MKKITSNLIALEVGHTVSIEDDGAAAILTELPTKQLLLDMKDATAYTFELKSKHFTLINTGCGSIAVRTV
ncbi:hypothetical protein CF88_18270 [Salmonella enterica subsp. enterica]|nr:hypothetical protein [Salmonella enterica subsp. enterica]EHG9310250.1 hypothetical protein [Salmonella enterica]EJL7665595.1 hypothetical protein [Salmonella enterica]EKF8253655.1 hypothetical protein [Salmonella enterica]